MLSKLKNGLFKLYKGLNMQNKHLNNKIKLLFIGKGLVLNFLFRDIKL